MPSQRAAPRLRRMTVSTPEAALRVLVAPPFARSGGGGGLRFSMPETQTLKKDEQKYE